MEGSERQALWYLGNSCLMFDGELRLLGLGRDGRIP
jgi:hypothetical protein